ncbi:hypothetical protein [Lysobacter gummosus]
MLPRTTGDLPATSTPFFCAGELKWMNCRQAKRAYSAWEMLGLWGS